MKTLKIILLAGCTAALFSITGQAADIDTNAAASGKVRIGTYDSRSLAIAYAGSTQFNQWLGNLRAEHDRAKAAGDQQRAAALEAEGKAQQKLMHMQGFSTAPVTNILDQIKDQLPSVKEQAGVSALVSKWDKTALAAYPNAEKVDVTVALVTRLHPSELQRQRAMEILKHDPIPLDQAAHIDD